MIRIKLSPSKIEKFRQFNEGEYEETIKRENLIDTITGKEVWTPRAEFGTAFHSVMRFGAAKYRTNAFFGEDKEENRIYHIQDEGMPSAIECYYSEIELADMYHFKYTENMSWEVWHTFIYVLDMEYEIEVRLRMDSLYGIIIKEHKTTASTMSDYAFYERSCQWRTYLMGLKDSPLVVYERFLYKEPAELAEGKTTRRKGARDRRDVERTTFSFFRYPDMEKYVEANMRGIIGFCRNNVDEKGESLMKYILR